jgi:hypothetical protein
VLGSIVVDREVKFSVLMTINKTVLSSMLENNTVRPLLPRALQRVPAPVLFHYFTFELFIDQRPGSPEDECSSHTQHTLSHSVPGDEAGVVSIVGSSVSSEHTITCIIVPFFHLRLPSLLNESVNKVSLWCSMSYHPNARTRREHMLFLLFFSLFSFI